MPSIKINMADRQSHNWLIHHIYYRQSWLITVICCMKWSKHAMVLCYDTLMLGAQSKASKVKKSFPDLFLDWWFMRLWRKWWVVFFLPPPRRLCFHRGKTVGWLVGKSLWLCEKGSGCFWLVAQSPFVCQIQQLTKELPEYCFGSEKRFCFDLFLWWNA